MNVNLSSIWEDLMFHRQILVRAFPGETIGSLPILLPDEEMGTSAGYQVWWPIEDQFLHVTPDGDVVRVDFLPTSEDFS